MYGIFSKQVSHNAYTIGPTITFAADKQGEKYPYGGSQNGTYGQKKEVSSVDDAKKVLTEYFSKKEVKIGEIKEKKLYFEAHILDKNDNLIDIVIIDKRTGRIRSIY
jgi:hypothetical protein